MQLWFQDALGAGFVERTRGEALGRLTRPKFAEFFEEYKASLFNDDPLWLGEKSACGD